MWFDYYTIELTSFSTVPLAPFAFNIFVVAKSVNNGVGDWWNIVLAVLVGAFF